MPTSTTRTAAVLACVPLLLIGAGTRAGADDKRPPAMSIELTNGVDTVRSGAELTYTVTLLNQDMANLTGLRVEQVLPSGSTAAAAGQRAKVAGGRAVWTADVQGHGRTVLTSSARLGAARAGALRAASTVCAYLPKSQVPVVCSSDMDLLPVGKAEGVQLAEGVRESAGMQLADAGADSTWWDTELSTAIGTAVGAALLVGGGVLVLRRRGRTAGRLR